MPKKSCDLDPIPISVLYDCLDEIIPTVTSIMNMSLSSGIVPQCFKHALVKPLLKTASLDPNCLKHYRPVSNLPFLSKVLERIVPKQFSTTFDTKLQTRSENFLPNSVIFKLLHDLYRLWYNCFPHTCKAQSLENMSSWIFSSFCSNESETTHFSLNTYTHAGVQED